MSSTIEDVINFHREVDEAFAPLAEKHGHAAVIKRLMQKFIDYLVDKQGVEFDEALDMINLIKPGIIESKKSSISPATERVLEDLVDRFAARLADRLGEHKR